MNERKINEILKNYICRDILKNEDYPLRNDEPLLTGGLVDSFSLVHIAIFIEKEFRVKIPDTELSVETMDTICMMTERILKDLKR